MGCESGDSIITSPTINLQKDPETGQSYLALALFSIQKLQETNPYVKKNFRAMPSAEVAWSATAQAPLGSLKVVNGKLTVPGDVAAVVGDVVNCDVALGMFATAKSIQLQEAMHSHRGTLPLCASLWSECGRVDLTGFFDQSKQRLELLHPMKAEVKALALSLLQFRSLVHCTGNLGNQHAGFLVEYFIQ